MSALQDQCDSIGAAVHPTFPDTESQCQVSDFFAEHNPLERINLYTFHGFGDRKMFLATIDEYTRERYSWIGLKCHPGAYQFFTADGYFTRIFWGWGGGENSQNKGKS